MALTARDLKNNDTTDIGYDLVMDPVTSPVTGDVGVCKLMIGIAGANDGLVSATYPLPVDLGTNNDVIISSGTISLPTNAATDTLQTAGNAILTTIDTSLNAIEASVGGTLTVALPTDAATQTTLAALNAKVTECNTGAVVISSGTISLPTNASTDTLQTSGNASLSTIAGDTTSLDGKITACNTGAVTISAELPAGTQNIGDVDIASSVTLTVDATGQGDVPITLDGEAVVLGAGSAAIGTVVDTPTTSGGLDMYMAVSAASINDDTIKASAGQVYSVQAMNKNTNPRYVKLYNKASNPTPGSDSALLVKTLMIPGNTSGTGMVLNWDKGLDFTTGIAVVIVSGMTTTDVGTIGSEDVVLNVDYK